MERSIQKAEATGNAKEKARLEKEYRDKYRKMDIEQRKNLKIVEDSMERQRIASERAL